MREPKGGDYGSRGKLLLRCCPTGGDRRTRGNGLLSLPILPVLVRRTGERFQPLEARGGAGYRRRGAGGHLPEDAVQPAAILREMRRTPDGQPSDHRSRGRVCRDNSHPQLRSGCSLQLRRDGTADAGWFAKAAGFPGRGRGQRRDNGGVTTDPAEGRSSSPFKDVSLKSLP